MITHVVKFKLTPFPYGGPIASKFIGEITEERKFYDLSDEQARNRAKEIAEQFRKSYCALSCTITQIRKITEETISI